MFTQTNFIGKNLVWEIQKSSQAQFVLFICRKYFDFLNKKTWSDWLTCIVWHDKKKDWICIIQKGAAMIILKIVHSKTTSQSKHFPYSKKGFTGKTIWWGKARYQLAANKQEQISSRSPANINFSLLDLNK